MPSKQLVNSSSLFRFTVCVVFAYGPLWSVALLIKIKIMSPKSIKKLVVLGISLVVAVAVVSFIISTKKREVRLRNEFKAKLSERATIYDNKVFKTVASQAQIALKADSSFQKVVDAQMSGQKDAPDLFMKWVQQSNPAATWVSVQELYKGLSRTVEAVRTEFVQIEKVLQDVKLQHDDLRTVFPSSLVVAGVEELSYKPITSDRTDEVMRTGKDNNTNVFQ